VIDEPVAEVIATGADSDTLPIAWDEATGLFAAERWYWISTTGDESRPHLRPVIAVYIDHRVFSTTSSLARKARDLISRPMLAIAARAPAIDIVIEGKISWVDDIERLQRVADAYQEKYGWPVTVAADSFDAPYGAPTAGNAPYRVYELTPTAAYAFGTANNLGERSTRYRFNT
jgi:Pyridoxamine 5'-phosphate oxidase